MAMEFMLPGLKKIVETISKALITLTVLLLCIFLVRAIMKMIYNIGLQKLENKGKKSSEKECQEEEYEIMI